MKRYSAFLALLFTVAFGVHVLAQPAGFGGQPIGFPHAASGGGGGGAPTDAKYITQTPDGTLTNEQALSALSTGILKNTTTTGVLSIAAEGTDYYKPGGTDVAIADGGTGASTKAGGFDALSPMTTAGDLIYFSTTGTRLALGTSGTFLKAGASAPSWANIATSDVTSGTFSIARGGTNSTATPTAGGIAYGDGSAYKFSSAGTTGQAVISGGTGAPTIGVLGETGGGTNQSSYTKGDMLISTGANTLSKLAIPSVDNERILGVSSGQPAWSNRIPGFSFTDSNPWLRQIGWMQNAETAAGITSIGGSTWGQTGTTSNGADADGGWVNYASAATTASIAGVSNTGVPVQPRHGLRFVTKIKIPASGDILVTRLWVGLSTGAMSFGTPTTTGVAAFRYATDVDGTAFWRTVTCDGSSNVTTNTTSVAVTGGSVYTLGISTNDGTSYDFWINGTKVFTHTTNLPNSTNCGQTYVQNITQENVAKNLKNAHGWLYGH